MKFPPKKYLDIRNHRDMNLRKFSNYQEYEDFEKFKRNLKRVVLKIKSKGKGYIKRDFVNDVRKALYHEKEHAQVIKKYGFKPTFGFLYDDEDIVCMVYAKNKKRLTKDWNRYKHLKFKIESLIAVKWMSESDLNDLIYLKNRLKIKKKLNKEQINELLGLINKRLKYPQSPFYPPIKKTMYFNLMCLNCETEKKAKINVSKAINLLCPRGCSSITEIRQCLEAGIRLWDCGECKGE